MNSVDSSEMKRDEKSRQGKEKMVFRLQHKHITKKSRISASIQRKKWVKGHFRQGELIFRQKYYNHSDSREYRPVKS